MDKSDTVKETRKQVYTEAQEKRTKGGDAAAETKAIQGYWATYQNQNATYYTNDMWEAYKSQHDDELDKLFENFLVLVLKNKDKKDWNIGGIGKFISPENAVKYLGDKPIEALESEEKFHIDFSKLSGNPKEMANTIVSKELIKFESFERLILFNLYKEQQKHEFDYFFYEADKKNK